MDEDGGIRTAVTRTATFKEDALAVKGKIALGEGKCFAESKVRG